MNELDNVDQSTEVNDTETAQTDISPETPASLDSETDASVEQSVEGSEEQTDAKTPSLPFSQGGKEKFKINGADVEWDWETTKRYAQKGYAGMQALQRAAEVEKKARQAYGQILELAQKDPDGLIKTLNPNWKPHPQGQAPQSEAEDVDPREAKIRDLESRLEKFEKKDTQTAVEQERIAVANEIAEAEKNYPTLKGDKFALNYIKSEYRKALNAAIEAGMEPTVTIDDIAFYVSQELQESRKAKTQEQQKRIEQKRKQAPVTTAPGAPSETKKPMTREDVMRLAGRTV